MAQVNVNIEDIKKMASLLVSNQNGSGAENNIQKVLKQVKNVGQPSVKTTQATNSSENNDQIISLNGNEVQDNQNGGAGDGYNSSIISAEPGVFVVMGYSLPVHTFYLIIFLLILGLVIWYLNSNYRKSKKKIVEKHDDENESSE